ncbi:hypothetical protein [Cyclobacterium marinum]|uniref:hypothetical protein n=1 Tax=Cyclobacterium marinum TaxID=104 RepID=UPI0011ED9871|nr:hypothetical protein [Cyclobacterium marinum]MBI0397790.1 hypothetical protein [Cyclobacterium marinum]
MSKLKTFNQLTKQTIEQNQHSRQETINIKVEHQQLIECLMELRNKQNQIMKNQKILQIKSIRNIKR